MIVRCIRVGAIAISLAIGWGMLVGAFLVAVRGILWLAGFSQ